LLQVWLAAGQPYVDFWDRSIAEVNHVARLSAKQRLIGHDESRLRNHELACWIAIAVSAPDKMPNFVASGEVSNAPELPPEIAAEIEETRARIMVRSVSRNVSR